MLEYEVTPLLAQVTTPTLILHRRGDRGPPFQQGREIASRIPAARFAPLEGNIHVIWLGDTQPLVTAINGFLSSFDEPQPRSLVHEGLQSVLFTDIEGSTTLTQRLGDAKSQEILRAHNAAVRDALKAHAGTEIKHTGDGIMASFASAARALGCAVAIQRALTDYNQEHPEAPIRVRIGLNAGEPVAEEEDLFGTAVQLARRICDRAEPGQILASNVVQELAAGKGFVFGDEGDVALKGFEKPVRLYEVSWQG
jgi:adenylate cyclase